MRRITISLTDETASALDQLVECRGYANRSEAVRDLIREAASQEATAGNPLSLGVLSYVFDHQQRDLARRLTTTHHDHHVSIYRHCISTSIGRRASKWWCCAVMPKTSANLRSESARNGGCASVIFA